MLITFVQFTISSSLNTLLNDVQFNVCFSYLCELMLISIVSPEIALTF